MDRKGGGPTIVFILFFFLARCSQQYILVYKIFLMKHTYFQVQRAWNRRHSYICAWHHLAKNKFQNQLLGWWLCFSVIQNVKDNGRQFLLLSISTHGNELDIPAPSFGYMGDSYHGNLCDKEHYLYFSDGTMATQEILDKLDDYELKDVTKIVLISVSTYFSRLMVIFGGWLW